MGKKRAAVRKDVFVNRIRGRLAFGANAATAVFESFNTGMNVGTNDPMKWIILGAHISPNVGGTDNANFPEPAAEVLCTWQLMIGTQDAMLDCDDMQVVASGHKGQILTTSGATDYNWTIPLDIRHPIPIFAQTLTVGMRAHNVAAINSSNWYYEIQYLRASISQNEIVEYLAAFGQV